MSKRDWDSKFIAIILATCVILTLGMLTVGYFTGYNLGKDHADTEYSADYHENYAADRIERECGGLDLASSEGHDCVEKQIQASVEHQTAYADLKSQERMAFWAILMGIFTGLTFFVTFAGVIYVAMTLQATRDMTIETRKIGQAQVRAYLSIKSIQFVGGEPKSTFCAVSAKVTNTGQSPVINPVVSYDVSPVKDEWGSFSNFTPSKVAISDIEPGGDEEAAPSGGNLKTDFSGDEECVLRVKVSVTGTDVFEGEVTAMQTFIVVVSRTEQGITSECKRRTMQEEANSQS